MPELTENGIPEWVEGIIETTRLIAKNQVLSPCAFVSVNRGNSILYIDSTTIPRQHSIEDAKDIFAAAVRRMAIEMDADAVLVISEAWMRKGEPGETLESIRNSPVKDHPDRVEAVAMILETMHGSWMATSPFEGKMGERKFGKIEFEDASRSQGRFTNFLPDKNGPVTKPN